jgi:hypothetical protein
MEGRQVRTVAVRLDAENASLVAREHDVEALQPGPAADFVLDHEAVGFLDEQVEPLQKVADVVPGDAFFEHPHRQVRIDANDPAGHEDGFVGPEIVKTRAQAVDVGQVELVDVGQHDLAAQMLLRHRDGGLAADRETDDADALGAQQALLLARDLVVIPIGDDLVVRLRIQQVHDGDLPGQVHPVAAGLSAPVRRHQVVGKPLPVGRR